MWRAFLPAKFRLAAAALALTAAPLACTPLAANDGTEKTTDDALSPARRTPYWIDPPLGGAAYLATGTADIHWRAVRTVPYLTELWLDGAPLASSALRVDRTGVHLRLAGGSLIGRHRLELVNPNAKGPDRSPPVALRIDPGHSPALRPQASIDLGRLDRLQRVHQPSSAPTDLWGWSHGDSADVKIRRFLATDGGWQADPQIWQVMRPRLQAELLAMAIVMAQTPVAAWVWADHPHELMLASLLPDQAIVTSTSPPIVACNLFGAGAASAPEWCEFTGLVAAPDAIIAEIVASRDVEVAHVGDRRIVELGELTRAGAQRVRSPADSLLIDLEIAGTWLYAHDGSAGILARHNRRNLAVVATSAATSAAASLQTSVPLLPADFRLDSGDVGVAAFEGVLGDATLMTIGADAQPRFYALAPRLGLWSPLRLREPIAGPASPPTQPPLSALVGGSVYFLLTRQAPASALLFRSDGQQIDVQALPLVCDQASVHRRISDNTLTVACRQGDTLVQFNLAR